MLNKFCIFVLKDIKSRVTVVLTKSRSQYFSCYSVAINGARPDRERTSQLGHNCSLFTLYRLQKGVAYVKKSTAARSVWHSDSVLVVSYQVGTEFIYQPHPHQIFAELQAS